MNLPLNQVTYLLLGIELWIPGAGDLVNSDDPLDPVKHQVNFVRIVTLVERVAQGLDEPAAGATAERVVVVVRGLYKE